MHRFAQINGVKLALPTIGDGSSFISSSGFRNGTAVDNIPAGENNPTYDDLLAIWDAHNGGGTSQGGNGTPAGWQVVGFWSATPATNGHARLYTGDGFIDDLNIQHYAVLQVLL